MYPTDAWTLGTAISLASWAAVVTLRAYGCV
jgi:hypothetical protein